MLFSESITLGVTVPNRTGVPGHSSPTGGVEVPSTFELLSPILLLLIVTTLFEAPLSTTALPQVAIGFGVLQTDGVPALPKLFGVLAFLGGGAGLDAGGAPSGVPGLANGTECDESVLPGRDNSTVTAVTLKSGRFSVKAVAN